MISDVSTNMMKLIGNHINNTYMINIDHASSSHITCLSTNDDISWLWHRRIAYIYMHYLNKLAFKELVRGLSKLNFKKEGLCDVCQKGKHTRACFKSKNEA